MRFNSWIYPALFCSLAAFPAQAEPKAEPAIPHLEKRGQATQLIVDGKPFLILGGELFNNSATSLEFMKPVWPRMKALRLNTILAAVSWGQFEPAEGKFDYTLVDGLIREARLYDERLVLLWFGSWKNSWSSYAPDWVKRDIERFPRAQLRSGAGTERLSAFSDACRDADARAFAAFMRRIREIDSDAHTVIMIQVENEVGMIPDARDYSPLANAVFEQPVPKELVDYLNRHKETLHPALRARWAAAGFQTSGNWETVFGAGLETADLFMAWHYARYIGKVTEAGKAQYNLPMFTNAALIRPSYAPGQYNSGGPLAHSIDIWRAGGPQLDFLAPDIYFEFKKWSAEYDRPGNPLFIPEAAGGPRGGAQAFYAIGNHAAIGYSPFGIDRPGGPDEGDKEFGRDYEVLSQIAPLILEHQPKGRVVGVMLEELTRVQRVQLGGYTLNVSPIRTTAVVPTGPEYPREAVVQAPHGIFIATGPDEFFLGGNGLSITFSPETPGLPIAGLATVEEGQFLNGNWQKGRTLAGDDTDQGNAVSLRPGRGLLRVTLYRYR